jgi:hypothetical protein
VPHQAVGRVLNTSTHHVVTLGVSKALQGLTESYIEMSVRSVAFGIGYLA